MKGSTGMQALIQRWFINRHYKSRLKVSLNLEGMIRKRFYKKMGYKLDLENPRTFNEKLQWFKLHVRDPRTTRCADKYAVREYVAEKIGGGHLVPLLGVYDSVDEIDISSLPQEFVLKPNHESGRVILCHDKNKMDWKRRADEMKNWLRENYYYQTGEWQYKDIPPKILCEKMLHGDVVDYRFFCFNGEVFGAKITGGECIKGHFHKIAFSDVDFHLIKMTNEKNEELVGDYIFDKPEHWDQMIQMSKILSLGFPFVRVDLYDLEGTIYFSELTFTPGDGTDFYLPRDWDKKMGKLYDIHAWNS